MTPVAAILVTIAVAAAVAVLFTYLPGWLMAGALRFVRAAVRSLEDDEDAELWAARFRNAADEGLRDRDARKERRK